MAPPTARPRIIYWFRTDLRLHDSPALAAALALRPECLWPVWCWDPHYVYRARVGPNRWQYLLDCQNDLSASITKLNPRSKLFVIREAPQTLLPKLFREWRISHLVFEKDSDAYARERDAQVMALAKEAGVEVLMRVGRSLYDLDELVRQNGGRPTMSMAQVLKAAEKLGEIPHPIPAPTSIPDPGETPLDFEHQVPEQQPDLNAGERIGVESSYVQLAGPNGDFAPPTMSELGLRPATTLHRGGETLALATLAALAEDKDYIAQFEKPKTAPTAFLPQSTTLLSPHMHFGSLSVRHFYWTVRAIADVHPRPSQNPVNLTGQLLFREMYLGAQAAIGSAFVDTIGNAHVRFIPWHLQTVPATPHTYAIDSGPAAAWLHRWTMGTTGFPYIDAAMRQLRLEGWIHHLARHSVACFLTRGGAWIAWERGAAVFEALLLDHEPACNAGNWQWLACAAFSTTFFRVYSPVAFPQRWDKKGAYVRRYVPELADYPDRWIYEPSKAPRAVQRDANCLIRGDGTETEAEGMKVYPEPMFDFAEQRTRCLEGMKLAYKIGLRGADPKVADGSWRKLWPTDAAGLAITTDLACDGDGDASLLAAGNSDREDETAVPGQKRAAPKGQRSLDAFVVTKRAKR